MQPRGYSRLKVVELPRQAELARVGVVAAAAAAYRGFIHLVLA